MWSSQVSKYFESYTNGMQFINVLCRYELLAKHSFKTAINGSEEFTKVINKLATFYGPQRYKNRLHFRDLEDERRESHIKLLKIFPVCPLKPRT